MRQRVTPSEYAVTSNSVERIFEPWARIRMKSSPNDGWIIASVGRQIEVCELTNNCNYPRHPTRSAHERGQQGRAQDEAVPYVLSSWLRTPRTSSQAYSATAPTRSRWVGGGWVAALAIYHTYPPSPAL